MRMMFLLCALCTFCFFTPARSEIRYVMLPDLIGHYSGAAPETRTAPFDLGVAPRIVRGAKIGLVGGATVGVLVCPDPITLEPREFPWPFELDATIKDAAPGDFWIAGGWTANEAGPFAILDDFRPLGGGWTFLDDGKGQVDLRVVPTGYIAECIPTVVPALLIVTEAYLVLDAEFPVPVETTTWGQIKALYEVDR